MSFFQKVRSIIGLGNGVNNPIDNLDDILFEEVIALHELKKAQNEFDEISEELELKNKACQVLISKGNPDGELNRSRIQSKLEKITEEYLNKRQAISAQLIDIAQRRSEEESVVLTKSVEFVASLPVYQQAHLKDLMNSWSETGKVNDEEIESHTMAIVKAIDEISDGFFQKAVAAKLGEERTWGKRKFRKTGSGWVEVKANKEKKHSTQEVVAHAENTSTEQLKKVAADENKDVHIRDAAKREIERRSADKDKEKRQWGREDKLRAQDKEASEQEKAQIKKDEQEKEAKEAKAKKAEDKVKEKEKSEKDAKKQDEEFGFEEDVAGHHVIDSKTNPGAKRHIHVIKHPKGDKYTVQIKDNLPNGDGTETIRPYSPKDFDKETFNKFWDSVKQNGVRRLGEPSSQASKKKKDKELPVKYTPAEDLSPEHSKIEKTFGKYLNSKFKEAKIRYEAKFGNVLNTDNARELSSAYESNRSELSAAVHEPASSFIKKIYAEKLAENVPPGKVNMVLFTAGGTGSGKTTGMQSSAMNGGLDKAHIVYDTNMNTFETSVKKIEQALSAGKSVRIGYTFRDPVDAFENGAVPRSLRIGRTVPIEEHVKTHLGSMDTMIRVAEKYKGNKNVKLTVIDNSNGAGNAKKESISFVKSKNKMYNANELREKLHKINDSLYEQGRITESHYKGFKGNG